MEGLNLIQTCFNPLMHNIRKWSDFKNLAVNAARFLSVPNR